MIARSGTLETPMDLREFDNQLHERIQTLLLRRELREGTAAFSVATKVIHSGFDSLSWEQKFICLGRVVPLTRSGSQLG